jgi:hypothetical protein
LEGLPGATSEGLHERDFSTTYSEVQKYGIPLAQRVDRFSTLLHPAINSLFLPFTCFYNDKVTGSKIMTRSLFDTPFDELPIPKQVWMGKPGSYEEGLGKLAILTPEVVARAAASEIKCGRRVTMNWEMTKLDYPNLNRQPCSHQIVPLLGGVAFDDVYSFNPRKLKAR